MKTTLFIFGIFIAFSNACNQNTQSNASNTTTSEKTAVANNSDSIKNNIVPKEAITEITTDNNLEKKKDYFTLLSATSQSWTSGIAGGGSGTEYYFKIKVNTADKLLFDSAWVNNKAFQVFISKETKSISNEPIKYGNGDVISIRISDIKNQNIKITNSNTIPKFEGAALISFTVNDKIEYFIIKEIKKQNSPNRQ
jgi:hypothetical protein